MNDRYVVSEERLEEIRRLITEDEFGAFPADPGVSTVDLANAVSDLLSDRDDAGTELRAILNEVEARIDQGANSHGYLQYVRDRLRVALGADAGLLDVYDLAGNVVARIPRPFGLDLPDGTRLVFETTPIPPLDEDGEPYDPEARAAAEEERLIDQHQANLERREMEADERDEW